MSKLRKAVNPLHWSQLTTDGFKPYVGAVGSQFGHDVDYAQLVRVYASPRESETCLTGLGHEVIVANARRVRLISESSRKDDRLDAKILARLVRIDPELLSPIRHRSAQAQADLMVVRARAALVEARTMLVNAARGLTKSYGGRLGSCGTGQICERLAKSLSEPLQNALKPLLAEVESLSARIREYDEQIEAIATSRYPETELLKQVHGVGALTALTYVLTVEDPYRFRRSRDAGAYFGLRPGRRESGDSRPQGFTAMPSMHGGMRN